MALSGSAGHSPSSGTFLPSAWWSWGGIGPLALRATGAQVLPKHLCTTSLVLSSLPPFFPFTDIYLAPTVYQALC